MTNSCDIIIVVKLDITYKKLYVALKTQLFCIINMLFRLPVLLNILVLFYLSKQANVEAFLFFPMKVNMTGL